MTEAHYVQAIISVAKRVPTPRTRSGAVGYNGIPQTDRRDGFIVADHGRF
jgi:hypothetical protein